MAPARLPQEGPWAHDASSDNATNASTPTSTSYAYGSFPFAQDATATTSASSTHHQGERGELLPSHQQGEPVVQRGAVHLRWRAIVLCVFSSLGFACLLLAASRIGHQQQPAPQQPEPEAGAAAGEGDSFLQSEGEGSVFAALRLGFPGPAMLGAPGPTAAGKDDDGTTAATAAAAAPAAADPSPPYPSSAPQDPSIKIPVTMGCMEAMCESWMAAMGKAYTDKPNLVLLDCIQRTGMSANDTRACFDRANVAASPIRTGLYQCSVCKGCLPPKDAKEKKRLCSASASGDTSAGPPQAQAKKAPSTAADWRQYVPGNYVPNGMLRVPDGWFARRRP